MSCVMFTPSFYSQSYLLLKLSFVPVCCVNNNCSDGMCPWPVQAQHLPLTFPPFFPHKVNSGSVRKEVPNKMKYTKWCKPFFTISLQLETKREKSVQVLPNDVNQNPQLDEPAHHSHPPVPHQHLAGSLILKEEVGEGAGDLVLHLLSRLTHREEGLCFTSLAYKNSQEILFFLLFFTCGEGPLPPLMNNLLYSSCEVLKTSSSLPTLSLACSPSLLLLLSLSASLHTAVLLSAFLCNLTISVHLLAFLRRHNTHRDICWNLLLTWSASFNKLTVATHKHRIPSSLWAIKPYQPHWHSLPACYTEIEATEAKHKHTVHLPQSCMFAHSRVTVCQAVSLLNFYQHHVWAHVVKHFDFLIQLNNSRPFSPFLCRRLLCIF